MVQTSAVGEAGQMGKKVYASEKDIVMVPKNEQVFLQTATSVNDQCNLTLKMSFQGHLSDGLEGLYLSKYKNGDGAVSNIVSTHFEPSSARLAFPCWDEPEFKAKFTISVVRPKGLISLSNMPLKKTEDLQFYQPGTERDDFMTSVPMSTYLVAIAVCDYVYLRSTTAKGVKISLYAPAEQVSRGGLALNTALQVLTYYEEFFGVSYPLPKLDMIAIPGFSAGAMENWGLVTYRMTSLLADDAVSSERQKQIVVQTVAHELAHQWFGNLVTMKWWNDLWLNEGFASWVEVLGAKVSNPDWAITDQFYYDKVTSGLWLDSLQSSHPVSPPEISSVDESNSLFDEISYNKGPALLQMVADVIGLPTLRLGLKTYLKTHRYENADTKDLWAAVGSFTDFGAEGMKNFMNSWVDKQGYPLIELSMDDGELIARQRRYSNSRTPPCPGPAEAHLSNSPCSDIWNLRLTCLVGGRDGAASIDDSPSSFDTLDKASLFSDAFALT
ncbi:unnamed protein product [Notodromas monacha]|uniref:Aminopeptidase n=1 Tax=Notodromas monacha TaxID=399045 RepID=A0A7R9BLD5_9CRUS|nr:unnamed protein product [Notodromas monacha]CAG0917620.1 unnamed protein product [Notodromas monacha]